MATQETIWELHQSGFCKYHNHCRKQHIMDNPPHLRLQQHILPHNTSKFVQVLHQLYIDGLDSQMDDTNTMNLNRKLIIELLEILW